MTIVCLILTLLGTSAPASASLSRIEALGRAGQSNEVSPIPGWAWPLDDDSNAFRFPGQFAGAETRIALELGSLDLAGNYAKDGWGWMIGSTTIAGMPATAAVLVRHPITQYDKWMWDTTGWEHVYYDEDSTVRLVSIPEPRWGAVLALSPAEGHRLGVIAEYGRTQLQQSGDSDASAYQSGQATTASQGDSKSYGLSAGYGYTGAGLLREVDLGLHLRDRDFHNYSRSKSYDSTWTPGFVDFWLRDYDVKRDRGWSWEGVARAVVQASDEWSFVASGGWATGDMDWTYRQLETFVQPALTTVGRDRNIVVGTRSQQLDLGVAMRWMAARRATVFAGVQATHTRLSETKYDFWTESKATPPYTGQFTYYNQEIRTDLVPAFMGLEMQALPELAIRVGLTRNLSALFSAVDTVRVTVPTSTQYPFPPGYTQYRKTTNATLLSPTSLSAGWGWTLGDFTLDGVVKMDFLFFTAYAVSGTPSQVSTRLSASYRFGSSRIRR